MLSSHFIVSNQIVTFYFVSKKKKTKSDVSQGGMSDSSACIAGKPAEVVVQRVENNDWLMFWWNLNLKLNLKLNLISISISIFDFDFEIQLILIFKFEFEIQSFLHLIFNLIDFDF